MWHSGGRDFIFWRCYSLFTLSLVGTIQYICYHNIYTFLVVYCGASQQGIRTSNYDSLSYHYHYHSTKKQIAMISYNVIIGDTVTKVFRRIFARKNSPPLFQLLLNSEFSSNLVLWSQSILLTNRYIHVFLSSHHNCFTLFKMEHCKTVSHSHILANRNSIVFLSTIFVTLPLSLQKDIAKMSKVSTIVDCTCMIHFPHIILCHSNWLTVLCSVIIANHCQLLSTIW